MNLEMSFSRAISTLLIFTTAFLTPLTTSSLLFRQPGASRLDRRQSGLNTFTSPLPGDVIGTSSSFTLTWDNATNPSRSVTIVLLKAGARIEIVESNGDNDGEYDWFVSSSRATGSDYELQLFCGGETTSSGIFTILNTRDSSSVSLTVATFSLTATRAATGAATVTGSGFESAEGPNADGASTGLEVSSDGSSGGGSGGSSSGPSATVVGGAVGGALGGALLIGIGLFCVGLKKGWFAGKPKSEGNGGNIVNAGNVHAADADQPIYYPPSRPEMMATGITRKDPAEMEGGWIQGTGPGYYSDGGR